MSLEFRTLTVGPLETNCFVLWDESTRAAAIIDPGGDAAMIRDVVSTLGLSPTIVLLTHGHPDHCYAAAYVAREHSAEIGMHETDIEQVEQLLVQLDMIYDVSKFVPFSPTKLLNDGDVLHLGISEIKVLHTPGHSQGGLCFVTDAGVFCGDTIFADSIGRTDFPGGDHDQLIRSIKTKLLPMDDKTRLYPGHGPATTVGHERTTNPFLT